MKNLALRSIKFYQKYISPWLPSSCKFQPTCSQYMYNAIIEWGLFYGICLGVWRIIRCNPFNKGGIDEVPRRKNMDKLYEFLKKEITAREQLNDAYLQPVLVVGNLIAKQLQSGHKIAFCGNGGSATLASHLAAEFVGRYKKEKPSGFPALAFNDLANITALSNDYDFENVFAKQVEAYLTSGDILVGISTSGKSYNIIKAVDSAKKKNVITVVLMGKSGVLKGDYVLYTPAEETAVIQSLHLTIGHMLCEVVENNLLGD